MNSAVIASEPELPASEAAMRLSHVVLCRVMTDAAGEVQIVRDIASAAGLPVADAGMKERIARALAAQVASGQVERTGEGYIATEAGQKAAAAFLGARKASAISWPQARDAYLILKSLRIGEATAARLKAVGKLDGLRAAIVDAHWKLKIKGKPSASRVRSALALVALGRAFGSQVTAEFGAKSAMSSKASRLLAAQLSKKPKDFGTDARLVAALAAEVAGARRSELGQLRQGVLRAFLLPAAGDATVPVAKAPPKRDPKAAIALIPRVEMPAPDARSVVPVAPIVPLPAMPAAANVMTAPIAAALPIVSQSVQSGRPDLAGFARAVKAAARERAEGWAGNRRAFISEVWAVIRARYAGWQVSEIEFKAMLAEAHRVGAIALVYADLKDKRRLADVEASAVSYKNTVWHYVRVEDEQVQAAS